MHGLAQVVVATEGERQVADAAADVGTGQMRAYPARGTYEVERIAVVLLHARTDGQYVGVEDDVLWSHAHLLGQQPVGARGYLNATLVGGGLSLLVEAHHHDGSTQLAHVAGTAEEHLLALLERQAVDDALALQALQPRRDDLPVAAVDHHRYARYIGFRGYEVEECRHLVLRIQQPVVHIEVEHQCAVLHLLPCYLQRLVVVLLLDESQEFPRPCHIAPLAHIRERRHLEHVEPAQPQPLGPGHWHTYRHRSPNHLSKALNERGRGAAASTHNVHQPLGSQLLYLGSHRCGRLVVESHAVGQPRIGIGTNIIRCTACQLLEVGLHLAGTKRAVESHGEDGERGHRGQKGVERLSAQRASRPVADGHRQHDGQPRLHGGTDGRLGVERVEDGLYEQHVYPTLGQRLHLLGVGRQQLVVGHLAPRRVADVGRHGARLVGRAHGASHKARPARRGKLVSALPGQPCASPIHCSNQRL